MAQVIPEYFDEFELCLIDTELYRPGFAGAYLLRSDHRGALIETGTAHSVPAILTAIDSLGLSKTAIDWVVVTHVHLDHAGGSGELLRHLPNARLAVHPRGARHMIDPSRLWQGATEVYGEQAMARDYGQIVPVPEDRVVMLDDGQTIEFGERVLEAMHTPGHALHHMSLWDDRLQGWFTGDSFGLRYPALRADHRDVMIPSTSPVQFDPEAMCASIEKMLARNPKRMALTHYGLIDHPLEAGRQLTDQVQRMAKLTQSGPEENLVAWLQPRLLQLYRDRAQAMGCSDTTRIEAILQQDVVLNAQGLAIWRARQARS